MFKITTAQAANFSSPSIAKLFDDATRPFPTEDAFRLADIIDQINEKIKLYQKQARKVVEGCTGEIDKQGNITYFDPDGESKAESELEKLKSVELEFTGDLLTKTDDWPNLSLHEALILKPLIATNGKPKG